MVSQAELVSERYHSLVPGVISFFREAMGPFIFIVSKTPVFIPGPLTCQCNALPLNQLDLTLGAIFHLCPKAKASSIMKVLG